MTGETSPPILQTEHVGIRVRDLEAAVAFYRDLLGLPELDRVVTATGTTLVLLEMGNAGHVELVARSDFGPRVDSGNHAGIHHLAMRVPDLDAWVAYLRAKGVTITAGPTTMEWTTATAKLCFVADPEGNPVEFFERRPKA
jgi:catechol 2,3-dioxygenase-like lactoylglutathione lyase family enzyme